MQPCYKNRKLTSVEELDEANGESPEIPRDHRVDELIVSARLATRIISFQFILVDHCLKLALHSRISRDEGHQYSESVSKVEDKYVKKAIEAASIQGPLTEFFFSFFCY